MCDGIARNEGVAVFKGGLCHGVSSRARSARGPPYPGTAGHHHRFLLHSSISLYYEIALIQVSLVPDSTRRILKAA